jgi:hypothetical protein
LGESLAREKEGNGEEGQGFKAVEVLIRFLYVLMRGGRAFKCDIGY